MTRGLGTIGAEERPHAPTATDAARPIPFRLAITHHLDFWLSRKLLQELSVSCRSDTPIYSLKSRQVAERVSTHCHVSYGSRPCLPAEVSSGAAMCPMPSDLTSRLRWVLTLPRVIWLRTLPPDRGGLRRCHVSHDSLWAVGLKHKEKSSSPTCVVRHAYFQRMHASF
jgi:hypothetical protein